MEEELEDGGRVRSFRYEDYNNRRAFLRSYPLNWEGEEDEEEEAMVKSSKVGTRGAVKGIFLSVFQWRGGKVLLLRKIKHKVAYYLVACHPFGFKSTSSLLSV
ncbi:hypothetical protein AAC387_Pa03g4639 [Persea americana]|eukprot:TRINITY_DN29176_c0_g1_i1.p1 TRINITY_DN29176_c0_g1~~TRINITY_DN29176_c0_g1_i1.p1  ORF type:complete len:103 (-),score=28.26 TRINITY_DN29176_c0_g1_i1:441-749(-)